jgi:hypothetical protein
LETNASPPIRRRPIVEKIGETRIAIEHGCEGGRFVVEQGVSGEDAAELGKSRRPGK